MPVTRWKTLSCPQCDGQQLIALTVLRYHPAGGTSPEPSGYRCATCQSDVDQKHMLALLRKQELQHELQALESEQETLQQAVSEASSDASNASPTRGTRGSSNLRNT
jgi:hypothetical protein